MATNTNDVCYILYKGTIKISILTRR